MNDEDIFKNGTGIRPKEWSPEELELVKAHIKAHHAKRHWTLKLHNRLLGWRFRIEHRFDIRLGWLYPTINPFRKKKDRGESNSPSRD